jgi:hypothetical protein
MLFKSANDLIPYNILYTMLDARGYSFWDQISRFFILTATTIYVTFLRACMQIFTQRNSDPASRVKWSSADEASRTRLRLYTSRSSI